MTDKEKVIKELEILRDICNAKSNMAIGNGKVAWAGYANAADDAIVLLKEQEQREKRIFKGVCDFIRSGISTDTDVDQDYVCDEIQKIFWKVGELNESDD